MLRKFLNANYEEAVTACFDEGYKIACKEGVNSDHAVYYDAKYYYQSEEIHELLKEATKEYGEKYGAEVNPEYRDNHIKGDYLTRTRKLSFNSKWDFRASMVERSRIVNLDKVPPEGFCFFYKEGGPLGTEGNVLLIGGKDWKESEPSYKEFNFFLNSLVITRNWGDVTVIERKRQNIRFLVKIVNDYSIMFLTDNQQLSVVLSVMH